MQIPDRQTVLAPFAGEVATYDGLSARFSKTVEPAPVEKQDQPGSVKNTLVHPKKEDPSAFVIALEDAGRPEAGGLYQVRYTFGFSPLQQYLIEKEPGQIKWPFAFDTRPERLGGNSGITSMKNSERQDIPDWIGISRCKVGTACVRIVTRPASDEGLIPSAIVSRLH